MKPVQKDSRQTWQTPKALMSALREEYGPLFDPCPPNPTEDGLRSVWPLNRAAFVNPPYGPQGTLRKWAIKCFEQWRLHGNTVILLIPPYTDTGYFHEFILPWADIRFIRGRLRFDESKSPAPFPSILCIYPGRQESEFEGELVG